MARSPQRSKATSKALDFDYAGYKLVKFGSRLAVRDGAGARKRTPSHIGGVILADARRGAR